MENLNDIKWMKKALSLAQKAAEQDEVPVAAIIVKNNSILTRAFNKREVWNSPLGHAEIICIERAAQKLKSWRLADCTLYVTLEPCLMCSGAIIQSRIPRIVFGARDPKSGAVTSLYNVLNDPRLNHQVKVDEGVLAADCGKLLTDYFKQKRKKPTL
jgi:tRNA(adenine34) deaminase